MVVVEVEAAPPPRANQTVVLSTDFGTWATMSLFTTSDCKMCFNRLGEGLVAREDDGFPVCEL